MKKEQSARLEQWYVSGGILFGYIYEDSQGRVADGEKWMTSPILPMSVQMGVPREGLKILTKNTTYLLGERKK